MTEMGNPSSSATRSRNAGSNAISPRMVKVKGKGENRVEALRLADAFRARVIDATTESFVFEITGATDKIEQFIALMLPLGLIEVARTGIAAIMRGPEGM